MLLLFVSVFYFTALFGLILKFSCIYDPNKMLYLYFNGGFIIMLMSNILVS
jgi:hypothetical protein